MNNHDSRNIARNIGIFGGAQAFIVLAALVRTKVAAVVIGSAGVGLSALYNTSVTFFGNLSGMGLSFSSVKFLSRIYAEGDENKLREEVRKIRSLGLVSAMLGVLFAVMFSPVLSRLYFGDFEHILPFALLSIFVATVIISGIELAVLKSCRKIRQMAISTIWAAVVSVVMSVPFYIYKGIDGVIWAVLISGVSELLLTIYFGHRAVGTPYILPKLFGEKDTLAMLIHDKRPMLILGLAFLGGSVIASGAEMVIQAYFSAIASIAVLGLYKAGYQLSITYTGMIFAAVNNDFYPRLSAVNNNKEERNELISRQIKVLLMITTPLVALFIVLVPYILPILFDDTFNPICRMVQFASLSIIVKSVTMPLNFMPLSLGKSKHYLLLEGLFWLLLIPCVMVGYRFGGLDGTGLAILVCHVVELIYIYAFCKSRYGFAVTIGKA